MSTKYPEHENLQLVQDKSQAIGEFLGWLSDTKQIRFAKWEKVPDESEFASETDEVDALLQQNMDILGWTAEYFDINLTKLEQEKQAMLEELRKMNAHCPKPK